MNAHSRILQAAGRQWRRMPTAKRRRTQPTLDSDLAETIRPLFDANWYSRRYPEARASGLDPLVHYLKFGSTAGYDPHPMFWSEWYLNQNPDVAASGMNPILHYLVHGGSEKRDPHPLFDTLWYVERYPDVLSTSSNPLLDYIERQREGRLPGPLYSDALNWYSDYHEAANERKLYDQSIGRVALAPLPLVLRLSRAGLSKSGSYLYRRSRFSAASAVFRGARALCPSRPDELLVALAKAEIRCGHFDRAFECFRVFCNLPPQPQLGMEIKTRPIVHQGADRPGSIGVITSLMPKRIEAQQAAVQSWFGAGLSVISVNALEEADRLRVHFPGVTFRIIENPRVDTRGRPLVPVHSLIRTAHEVGHEVCGIMNSDIEFRGGPEFFDRVRAQVAGSLLFGCRIDFSDRKFVAGKAFRNGYDFFFWSRENSPLLEGTEMTLGMPWWDYWLPLHAHAQGLTIKRLGTSSMAHVNHAMGYEHSAYVQFGRICAANLAEVLGRWSDGHPPASRTFLHRLCALMGKIPATDLDTELRIVGNFCELINCMIDFISEKLALEREAEALGVGDPF